MGEYYLNQEKECRTIDSGIKKKHAKAINSNRNYSLMNTIQKQKGLHANDSVYFKNETEEGYGSINAILGGLDNTPINYVIKLTEKSKLRLHKESIEISSLFVIKCNTLPQDEELYAKGTFGIFDFDQPEQYLKSDESFDLFEKSLPQNSSTEEVKIGVMDTGTIENSQYLTSHKVKTIRATGQTYENPVSNVEKYMESSYDSHGTFVAGQAIYGSPKIKYVDIQIQNNYGKDSPGEINYANVNQAIEYAINNDKCKIITCSITIDWTQIDTNRYPEVVFLMTGGNEFKVVEKKNKSNNSLLIGGVSMEGKTNIDRGYGGDIDVTVPSGQGKDSSKVLSVVLPKRLSLKKNMLDVLKNRIMPKVKLMQDYVTSINRNLNERLSITEDCDNVIKLIFNTTINTIEKPENVGNDKVQQIVDTINRMEIIYNDTTIKAETINQSFKFVTKPKSRKEQIEIQKVYFETYKTECKSLLDQIIQMREEMSNSQPTDMTIRHEDGVSFGIPVIANVAAKMKLLNQKLTGENIAAIIKESYYTQDQLKRIYGGNTEGLYSDKMLNPILAYQKALEWEK